MEEGHPVHKDRREGTLLVARGSEGAGVLPACFSAGHGYLRIPGADRPTRCARTARTPHCCDVGGPSEWPWVWKAGIQWNVLAGRSSFEIACRMMKLEPLCIDIPAGWFSMGSDAGQSVEGPVRRVWVDGFCMAATQVTVAEYARFLEETGNAAPSSW